LLFQSCVSTSYDDQGRLLQLANTIGQTDLGTFSYGYDSPLLGQRTSMTSGPGATNYSYDSNYQLTGASYPNAAPFNGEVHAWTYDNIGNRLTNTVNASTANYTYFKNGANPLNGQRLQSDSVKTYAYDSDGNVTGDGTYTYTWDYENRLTGITGTGLTASYTYDYLGRRSSKTVNSQSTTFIYGGYNLIAERGASIADYCFARAIDEPLAMYRNSTISYYNVDGLGSVGSVVSVSGVSGTAQNTYVYDSWGVVKSQSSSITNSFGYTSREFSELSLDFYRARYYSSEIGRFIGEDPAKRVQSFAQFNGYDYGANEPIRFKDPFGLFAQGQVDGSCNCDKHPNPNNKNESLSSVIARETDNFCKTRMAQITNPKRRLCIQNSCDSGKVRCDNNCPNFAGGYPGPGPYGAGSKWLGTQTATICTNTQPPNVIPGRLGEDVIHEWAHTCGWSDCGGEGVPDPHACIGNGCMDCPQPPPF